ncbi:MAG: HesA/MoeB/ThiF family protein [Nevskiaceae bacterium]|nr:MAG: HesA/MoeB/ThiF family protein [Nevskiaceae bacterium]TBR73598.1 MAG: HesA/MoeB/ThiF family protein [Nevskiaceae bacterium]
MQQTDFRRYSRQSILPEIGVHGQAVLRDSAALVIGCGGLGCAAAPYLAGAGVGRLVLVDDDVIEASNLQRQLLFRTADVGQPKAQVAAAALRALNPEVEVEVHVARFTAEDIERRARDVDVVLDCSDNFTTRYAVNAACVHARTPLVSGAAIRFEGQLAVFDLRRGGPCYACLYPPTGDFSGERCEDAGILGPVVGTIGVLQALEALKLLLGLGTASGTLRAWNALSGTWRMVRMKAPDPGCTVCRTSVK